MQQTRIRPRNFVEKFVEVDGERAAVPDGYNVAKEADVQGSESHAKQRASAEVWRQLGDACFLANLEPGKSSCDAIAAYEKAVELDPDFALGWSGLADAYNLLTAYGNLSGPDAAAKMQPVLEKARQLDPNLAEEAVEPRYRLHLRRHSLFPAAARRRCLGAAAGIWLPGGKVRRES